MSEQIISVLDAICEKFGVAIDWTQENVLPYAKELCDKYIRYEIATSVAWCLIFATITWLFLALSICFHKKAIKLRDPYDPYKAVSIVAVLCWACLGFFGIVSIIGISCQTIDIITCLTFPEKKLIDFASTLMK